MADYSFVNATAENGFSEMVGDHLKGIGRLFYLHSPKDTMFERKEDVPNFFRQSWPYFLIFMILEHIVLRLEGKPGIRLNDGITSISHGILQECGRLLWRGAESFLYTWIYANFRILDLPWDSTVTWYAAALGVDFCYYWMHRACHEVHILWAQHQVHHTSEDFNMGVGIRQSMLQGWCGFAFYLPLALVIPPAQFVMHHQFSYLYMFWIHTEAIKSLGPLEYILNTPSHHRVHHGSNKYCLDVNYGGVLIIWDRLFGTFRPETDKIEIVYGLIYNQPSFNPLYLQSFYTNYIIEKFRSLDTWGDKLRAIFWGPSWEPGTPRLGDEDMKVDRHLSGTNVTLFVGVIMSPSICVRNFISIGLTVLEFKVENRDKYDVHLPSWCNIYLVAHYTIVLYGFFELASKYMGMTPISVLIFVLYVIASLTIIGMLFDNSKHAPLMEVIRCSALAFITRSVTVSSPGLGTALQIFYVASAMFWCLNILKFLEIKKTKKVE